MAYNFFKISRMSKDLKPIPNKRPSSNKTTLAFLISSPSSGASSWSSYISFIRCNSCENDTDALILFFCSYGSSWTSLSTGALERAWVSDNSRLLVSGGVIVKFPPEKLTPSTEYKPGV